MKFWIASGDASLEFTGTYAYHEAMNRNRVQLPTAKAHHATPATVVVEGNTVGHVPREIGEEQHNYTQCYRQTAA